MSIIVHISLYVYRFVNIINHYRHSKLFLDDKFHITVNDIVKHFTIDKSVTYNVIWFNPEVSMEPLDSLGTIGVYRDTLTDRLIIVSSTYIPRTMIYSHESAGPVGFRRFECYKNMDG